MHITIEPASEASIGRPDNTSKLAAKFENIYPIKPMRQILKNWTTAYCNDIDRVPISIIKGINPLLSKYFRFAKREKSKPKVFSLKEKG